MRDKRVCCCGTGVGIQIIAWFQIITSVVGLILFGPVLSGAIEYHSALAEVPELEFLHKPLANQNLILWTGVVGCLALTIVLAIFVLWGHYTRSPNMMLASLILGWVGSMLQVSFLLYELVVWHNTSRFLFLVITLVTGTPIGAFFLWLVNTHRKEIMGYESPDMTHNLISVYHLGTLVNCD
ncbi:unnamed protein product [Allacma fusca]|uniref:Uncharacterized protein n=1 Tax=Allacma fusca TaxID=39272 RepID=A0A8J2PXA1_9HEXA|nr:unnamed protein product [Allacma fusca]